jgi:hypothetical protein
MRVHRVHMLLEQARAKSVVFWWTSLRASKEVVGEAVWKRGIDIQLATAEMASSFHHYIPTRNRTKNKQAVLSYMGKNITKNENPHELTSW